jgi:hypothetical protein
MSIYRLVRNGHSFSFSYAVRRRPPRRGGAFLVNEHPARHSPYTETTLACADQGAMSRGFVALFRMRHTISPRVWHTCRTDVSGSRHTTGIGREMGALIDCLGVRSISWERGNSAGQSKCVNTSRAYWRLAGGWQHQALRRQGTRHKAEKAKALCLAVQIYR